jgi:hypothetical protein
MDDTMKHHVSLALLLTLPAALTLALLPPIANEPHYLFHRQDDRTVSVQQSYAPLDMTALSIWEAVLWDAEENYHELGDKHIFAQLVKLNNWLHGTDKRSSDYLNIQ